MYYCHGCDHYHDSKSDAGYNETPDHRSYCDDTMPEAVQTLFTPADALKVMLEAIENYQPRVPTNPATLNQIGKVDIANVD